MIFRQLKIMICAVIMCCSISLCGMKNYSLAQLEAAGNPYVLGKNPIVEGLAYVDAAMSAQNCAMACAFGCAMCAVRACDYCDRTELCRWVQQANIYSEQLLGALYSCGRVAEHNE